MTELTKENFTDEVLRCEVPVLIDFWAAWCGPCKAMAPVMDEMAAQYENRLKVAKVNVDEQSALAERHGIVSIPSFVVYKDGKQVKKTVGAQPSEKLASFLEDVVN